MVFGLVDDVGRLMLVNFCRCVYVLSIVVGGELLRFDMRELVIRIVWGNEDLRIDWD